MTRKRTAGIGGVDTRLLNRPRGGAKYSRPRTPATCATGGEQMFPVPQDQLTVCADIDDESNVVAIILLLGVQHRDVTLSAPV